MQFGTRYTPCVGRKKPLRLNGPTQKTPGGHTIPLPKRGEIMDALKKLAKPSKG
jgi:hypothetical protein